MELSWVIAVLLAAMASFISNLGVTLQKLHHIRTAACDAVVSKGGVADDYHKGWMWRVGLGLVFFGSLADFAALSFGPQSLVAPLGSLTLVSNVIFAPLLLKETIGHWDVLATILIVLGSSIAVIFGSHEAVTFSVFQLFGFFTRWDFILYALVISVYGVALYLAIQKIEKIEKEEGVHSAHYLQFRALHRFAYPSLSGTVGAQSVLFAKCFVELLGNTVRHWSNGGFIEEEMALPLIPNMHGGTSDAAGGANATDALPSSIIPPSPVHYAPVSQNMFLYWQTYFVFFSMLGAIFAQIKYLNDGLRRFDASYSVPVFTSFWIILSVVSGMIFYREYEGMDTMQCMLFGLGVLITVTGVITLGGREQAHFQHQQLATDDDEECAGGGADAVHHDGSINAAHAGAFKDEKHGYGRATHSEVVHHHGHHHHKHAHGHAHAHAHGHHDDTLELHLDDGDLDDVSISHAAGGGGGSGSGGSSSLNSASHAHVHTQHLYVSPRSNVETEGTVADGAKTVVLEASQRIHQAFNKLRGKGADAHPYSGGLHVPASSSSINRLRSDSLAQDESTDHSAAEDESNDPLILKNAGRGNMARKANNGTTRTPSRIHVAASPRSVPLPLSPSLSPPPVPSACDDHDGDSSGGGGAIQVDCAPPQRARQPSLTPTSCALYDPSPPAPSYTLPSPSSSISPPPAYASASPRSASLRSPSAATLSDSSHE